MGESRWLQETLNLKNKQTRACGIEVNIIQKAVLKEYNRNQLNRSESKKWIRKQLSLLKLKKILKYSTNVKRGLRKFGEINKMTPKKLSGNLTK